MVTRRSALLALGLLALSAVPAYAAGRHGAGGLAVLPIGGIFSAIGHALLGAFSWTVKLASSFFLVTIGALVKLLIPRSWAQDGVQVMRWIVEVPDYAGTLSSPSGASVYGFSGINALRDLFTWLGAGFLPLTLVYATSRAMVGRGDHVALPVARVLGFGTLLVFYPWLWEQAAAIVNQVTSMVLTLSPVVDGLHKLMLYAVDGVALGGWQLIDLGTMGALGIELLALIFLKVAIILLGALLFATGPIMIGLIPTDAGGAIARAWASAVGALALLPVAWATLFAVGALLIDDAGTAGPLSGGSSTIGSLLGGILLAVAGLATLWLCLRAAREAGGLLRIQLGGLLSLSRGRGSSRSVAGAGESATSAAQSLRRFSRRVSEAGAGAAGALAGSSPAGARVVRGGAVLAGAGRRGALGMAGSAGRAGLASAAPAGAMLLGRSRAGAVAVQMARAGTASWQSSATRGSHAAGDAPGANGTAPAASTSSNGNGAKLRTTSAGTEATGAGASRGPANAAGAQSASNRSVTSTNGAVARPPASTNVGASSGPGRTGEPSPAPAARPGAPRSPMPSSPSRGPGKAPSRGPAPSSAPRQSGKAPSRGPAPRGGARKR